MALDSEPEEWSALNGPKLFSLPDLRIRPSKPGRRRKSLDQSAQNNDAQPYGPGQLQTRSVWESAHGFGSMQPLDMDPHGLRFASFNSNETSSLLDDSLLALQPRLHIPSFKSSNRRSLTPVDTGGALSVSNSSFAGRPPTSPSRGLKQRSSQNLMSKDSIPNSITASGRSHTADSLRLRRQNSSSLSNPAKHDEDVVTEGAEELEQRLSDHGIVCGILTSIRSDPWLQGFSIWEETCFQLNLHEDVYFEPFYTMLAVSLLGVAAQASRALWVFDETMWAVQHTSIAMVSMKPIQAFMTYWIGSAEHCQVITFGWRLFQAAIVVHSNSAQLSMLALKRHPQLFLSAACLFLPLRFWRNVVCWCLCLAYIYFGSAYVGQSSILQPEDLASLVQPREAIPMWLTESVGLGSTLLSWFLSILLLLCSYVVEHHWRASYRLSASNH